MSLKRLAIFWTTVALGALSFLSFVHLFLRGPESSIFETYAVGTYDMLIGAVFGWLTIILNNLLNSRDYIPPGNFYIHWILLAAFVQGPWFVHVARQHRAFASIFWGTVSFGLLVYALSVFAVADDRYRIYVLIAWYLTVTAQGVGLALYEIAWNRNTAPYARLFLLTLTAGLIVPILFGKLAASLPG